MTQNTSVKLKDGYRERLKTLADARQRSTNWLLNEAVGKFLEREEARAALFAEMKHLHEEYVQGGRLHLTQDEVERWMEQLKADPGAPMPEPHP